MRYNGGKARKIVIQVKSGNVKPGDIRDLKGVLEREQAQLGAFLTLRRHATWRRRASGNFIT